MHTKLAWIDKNEEQTATEELDTEFIVSCHDDHCSNDNRHVC